MKRRLLAYSLLIIATAFWGVGGPIVKYSFRYISPTEFLFWRFVIASIISLPILLWYLRKNPINTREIPRLIALSLLGGSINLILTFVGFDLTTIVEASIIGSLTPMFVALAGAYFLNETLTKRKEIGVVLAISGTVVAVLNPLLNFDASNQQSLFGNLLLFAADLTWVLFVMLSKKWGTNSIKPFHVIAFSSFLAVPFFYFVSAAQLHTNMLPVPQLPALAGIAYMAIFGTLIAFTAYETAIHIIDVSEADLFNYLGPVWAIPLAIVWLGEMFDPALIVSVVLIFIGVVVAEYKPGLIQNLRGHHHAHCA